MLFFFKPSPVARWYPITHEQWRDAYRDMQIEPRPLVYEGTSLARFDDVAAKLFAEGAGGTPITAEELTDMINGIPPADGPFDGCDFPPDFYQPGDWNL